MSTGTAKTKWILELEDELTSGMKDINRTITQTEDNFDDLGNKVDENTDGIEDFTESYDDLLGSVGGVELSSLAGEWDGVKTSIMGASKAGWAFVSTPIGAAVAALAGIALATKEWTQYNEKAKEANIITQQITQLSGDELDNARVRAKALEKTFGVDFERILEVGKNNVKAFGGEYNATFDQIENGLIRGGKVNDEYLDSMREYPRLFAQNGFSIKDFQRIVNEGIDLGIYSDKLPDAIKEFSLSVNEQTTSSRDALENAFGKRFTDGLFKNIKDGSITPRDALISIAKETERVGVNAQQSQQLTADLFRGAGEDAGGLDIILGAVNSSLVEQERALTPLEENLRNVADANRELAEAQDNALKSASYITFSNNASLAWTKVKTAWYDGVGFVSDQALLMGDTIVTETIAIITVFRQMPTILKEVASNMKDEVIDVISSFGKLGDVVSKLVTFDFSGAKESAIEFKNQFNKEVGDVKDAAINVGKEIKDVYDQSRSSTRNLISREREGAVAAANLPPESLTPTDGTVVPPNNTNNGNVSGNGLSLEGQGSGSGKTINMTLNIENIFQMADGAASEVEDIADRVIARITDRLRDSTIALG